MSGQSEISCPRLAVDVIIRYPDGDLVLIRRGYEPFEGYWALPGGAVEVGEKVENAARREAKKETGLDVDLKGLQGFIQTRTATREDIPSLSSIMPHRKAENCRPTPTRPKLSGPGTFALCPSPSTTERSWKRLWTKKE